MINRIRTLTRNLVELSTRSWQPMTLSDLDNMIEAGYIGGTMSDAGVVVSERKAKQLTAVGACINIISDDVAKLPLILYKREGRGKNRDTENPLYTLLHDLPNPEMTSFTWRQTQVAHMLAWGNWYSEIEFDSYGRPKALWPLRPDRMTVHRNNGVIQYKYILPNGTPHWFDRGRIFHVKWHGEEGLVGRSPIQEYREAIGGAIALEKFGNKFFSNSARPGGVLELKGEQKLDDPARERLKKSWNEATRGLDNAHRVAILESGLEYKQIGISMEDAEFILSRKFSIAEIARIYRMPLHKINEMSDATYDNIEHQAGEYVTDTLQSNLTNIEQTLNWMLLTTKQRESWFFEFLVDGLLRGDTQARGEFYIKQFQVAAITPNEIRAAENRNPIDGGDELYVQLNMVPLSMASRIAGDSVGSGENAVRSAIMGSHEYQIRAAQGRVRISERFETLFRDAAGRVLKREITDVRQAVKKHFGERDAADFIGWVDTYYRDNLAPYFNDAMRPIVTAHAEEIYTLAAEEIGTDDATDEAKERFIRDYMQIFTKRYMDASTGQLVTLARDEDGDPAALIEERLTEWEDGRADKVARDEAVRERSAFASVIFFAAGMKLVWRARGGSTCPYCMRMDGKVISQGQVFLQDGDTVDPDDGEHDPMVVKRAKQHPPLHRGCDCIVTAG